ncbi:hypothetical protein PMAYCL1PPCAC_29088, partial [Pristionchus mayeri]
TLTLEEEKMPSTILPFTFFHFHAPSLFHVGRVVVVDMLQISVVCLCLSAVFAQPWSFPAPMGFNQMNNNLNQNHNFNNGFHPQMWQNTVGQGNAFSAFTQQPTYAAPQAPPAAPTEQTFTDSVVQSNGVSDPRRGRNTNEGVAGVDDEIHSGNERQPRTSRSHKTRKTRAQVVTPPTAIIESDPESRLYSLDDLKQICPPPTIKYIVLRTLKNGVEVAEEAEEVPVTTNAVAQKIAKEVQELMGGQGSGKREVSPSESSSSKKHKHSHSTTTAAPEEMDTLPTQEILDAAEEIVEVDDKCNSDSLKRLIVNNIVPGDAGASKRNIHNAVPASAPSVDVICSTTGFTYLVTTTDHCEAQADGVICFAYRNDQ